MTNWEPGTRYNAGDIVEYQGYQYKIIQPHSSQSDWAPDVTPALWGRLSGQQQHHSPPPQEHQHQQEVLHHEKPPSYGSDTAQSDQKVEVSHEENKKNWYDLDDNRKKQLLVGGGLAAGAALLAGGYFAYKSHEKSEEEKQAQTWALQRWLNEAKNRTDQYQRNGPSGPVTWVLTEGTNIPRNAIEVGLLQAQKFYICRAFFDGGVQVGKASPTLDKGAAIGYKHEEIKIGTYEILLGDMRALRWVPAKGKLSVSELGHRPVEGGHESDGTRLYIAKAEHKGVQYPGKASEQLDGAYIPYKETEKRVKEYEVLCYNS
ncbi:carbohydrate-binding module family 12 protein [Crucibulum laeve]|uniref:Carbohydrate-binding module family 12 protein n=1 Tax=Crucibulum laeve TaxID=68775 RepID=A0A5C3MIN7_9AGAR|nr:carbohydrate-binding module family 12 protein [Crucibulum laeve]